MPVRIDVRLKRVKRRKKRRSDQSSLRQPFHFSADLIRPSLAHRRPVQPRASSKTMPDILLTCADWIKMAAVLFLQLR
jgi:hypothetical protein